MKRVAILLYANHFDAFYKKELGIDEVTYLKEYRNEWSIYFFDGLKKAGINPILYIFSKNPTFYGFHKTEDGYDVRFLSLKTWYDMIGERISRKLWHLFFKYPLLVPSVKYFDELINIQAGIEALKTAIQEDNIDLLYVQEYWTARFDFLVHKLKMPIIGADHGGKSTYSIDWLKKRALPKAYKITCQTPEEVEKVRGYKAEAMYLPNPVDTDFFSLPQTLIKTSQRKTLLIVARLNNTQKRISDLIHSLTYLEESWSLDIIGSGEDAQMLEKLVSNLKLNHRVNFLGFVSAADKKREKYRNCGVYVMPSASEGLPLSALEAMSCGAPIVSSDIDAFKRIVQNGVNGIRVPVGDPSRIATAILKCFENRETYGLASREIVLNTHSNKTYFTNLAKLIEDSVLPNSSV